jgi:class 3 adenylate cyclase
MPRSNRSTWPSTICSKCLARAGLRSGLRRPARRRQAPTAARGRAARSALTPDHLTERAKPSWTPLPALEVAVNHPDGVILRSLLLVAAIPRRTHPSGVVDSANTRSDRPPPLTSGHGDNVIEMYSEFRELLAEAQGRNEWVAAINADIRGFSNVMSGDPAQTALYLRAIYAEILDGYFVARAFFKPTGDGLLLVLPFTPNEQELAAISKSVVSDALKLHDRFADMIQGHKLIQFPHPKAIGIGISVGSVSRLSSGDRTLDYTGRSLNVATRLMDLARPSGVVIDSTLDFDALDAKIKKRFRADHVYLKGVAESDGVSIRHTAPPTRIPERYRKPIVAPLRFEETPSKLTLAEAAKRPNTWQGLTHEPADRSEIEVLVTHPRYRSGKVVPGLTGWLKPSFTYDLHRGKPHVVLDFADIAARLRRQSVPAGAFMTVEIAYTVDPKVLEPPTD